MKKYLAIPLFCVYFLAVTGMIIQQTCCRSDFSIVLAQVGNQDFPDCCHHSSQKQTTQKTSFRNGCCNTKTVVVKTIHAQLSEKAQEIFQVLQSGLPTANKQTTEGCFLVLHLNNKSARANAPPGIWQEIPLYKLHQRFTFYG